MIIILSYHSPIVLFDSFSFWVSGNSLSCNFDGNDNCGFISVGLSLMADPAGGKEWFHRFTSFQLLHYPRIM